MTLYKARHVFNWGGGRGWVVKLYGLPWLWQAFWFPLSTAISNFYRWSWTWWFSARAQMKRMFHQNKLNPGDDETKAEFSRNWIVPLKFVKDYVDHLAQVEMRKEKMKVKGNQRSGWNKITTTLNESNCKILTKYRRWKFMNLICTWYVMESCLRGRSQSKWHI